MTESDINAARDRIETLLVKAGLRTWAMVGFLADGKEMTSERYPTDLDRRAVADLYAEWGWTEPTDEDE